MAVSRQKYFQQQKRISKPYSKQLEREKSKKLRILFYLRQPQEECSLLSTILEKIVWRRELFFLPSSTTRGMLSSGSHSKERRVRRIESFYLRQLLYKRNVLFAQLLGREKSKKQRMFFLPSSTTRGMLSSGSHSNTRSSVVWETRIQRRHFQFVLYISYVVTTWSTRSERHLESLNGNIDRLWPFWANKKTTFWYCFMMILDTSILETKVW